MFKRSILAAAVVAAPALVQAQTVEDLQKQIDILAGEIEKMRTEQSGGNPLKNVHIGGYGEHHYNNYRDTEADPDSPAGAQKNDQVDAHRFVLYFGYDFSDRIRFMSELEVEHGLVVDTDDGSGPGELELEQAYIEVDTSDNTRVKLGQFLLPIGIINETHEPDTFYGVERNALENKVIPTTWWETGALFSHDLGGGLSYDLALHSGLQVDDSYSIRSGRQKSAKAVANDGAWTGRLRYAGIKNLDLAVSWQRQNDLHQSALEGELGFVGEVPDASAELVETHARYSVGGLQLTAMYARWDIDSDTARLAGTDDQKGYLLEAGYRFIEEVGVFARHVNYDLQSGDKTDEDVNVNTYGVNWWIHPQVVLKADYDDVEYKAQGKDDRKDDAINLGIGWSF